MECEAFMAQLKLLVVSFYKIIIPVNFNLEQAVKAQWGSRGKNSTLSLTLVLDGSGWSTLHPSHFRPTIAKLP
jgi:hypothetical protein